MLTRTHAHALTGWNFCSGDGSMLMTMPPGTKYKYDPLLQNEKKKSKLARLSSQNVAGIAEYLLCSTIACCESLNTRTSLNVPLPFFSFPFFCLFLFRHIVCAILSAKHAFCVSLFADIVDLSLRLKRRASVSHLGTVQLT